MSKGEVEPPHGPCGQFARKRLLAPTLFIRRDRGHQEVYLRAIVGAHR